MRPTVIVPGRWVWGAVKLGAWFIALGITAAHGTGGWFFAGTLVFLALRSWVRHRPPVMEPPSPGTDRHSDRPSEGLTVDEVRALLLLAELNRTASGESLPPQPIQARRDQ